MSTILDVIDDFLAIRGEEEVVRLSGTDLWRFGEQVRNYAAEYKPPAIPQERFPLYLGGWPSANFYVAEHGQLVMSALLYAGQVLAKDPIADWFSHEAYMRPQHVSRQGYLDQEGRPDIARTRRFLASVIPQLRRLRPLIEAGVLILAPSEAAHLANHDNIEQLQSRLEHRLATDPGLITGQFQPTDLAVTDRVRGSFVFLAGDREEQLRSVVRSTLRYFAQDWVFANTYGVEYAAPWTFEHFVCEQGLQKELLQSPHQRVIDAVLGSQLPIFQGLTPDIVARIHDDDTFAEFRSNLYGVYHDLSSIGSAEDRRRQIAQAEEAVLRPLLQRAEREASRGFLSRMWVELTAFGFSLGARLLFDASTQDLGWHSAGREAVGLAADAATRFRRRPVSAWVKLSKHRRSIEDELPLARVGPSEPESDPWDITGIPEMAYRVAPGLVIFDPPFASVPVPANVYAEGEYRWCECGSGKKWKFCCKDLPPARLRQRTRRRLPAGSSLGPATLSVSGVFAGSGVAEDGLDAGKSGGVPRSEFLLHRPGEVRHDESLAPPEGQLFAERAQCGPNRRFRTWTAFLAFHVGFHMVRRVGPQRFGQGKRVQISVQYLQV